jgi:hypothetical protein
MRFRTLFIVFIFVNLFTIFGCQTESISAFNTEDQQDGSCYGTYGGMNGYCNYPRGK